MPTFLSDYEGVNSSVNARSGRGEEGGSQSGQSAKLFLQSSELGLPQPLTRRRSCPPFGWGGGTHALASGGVGGPNSDEGTDTVVLLVYMYFVGRVYKRWS